MSTSPDPIAVYDGLRPAELWRHFAALNSIPRPSGQEGPAREYVRQVAQAAGATWTEDARGNIVVAVDASDAARADAAVVAVQAHLDMVCQQRPDAHHDFSHDPIRPRREGDLVFASGTTLGADNGIGAAAALALLGQPGLRHGPLELIFTVEEETGLHGAMALERDLLRARYLVNLDSEDPEELTVGCAGGAEATVFPATECEPAPAAWTGARLIVSGLQGGHSGVQIHQPLANAIKLLATVLSAATGTGCRIAAIEGGSAHNAIPRDAAVLLAVESSSWPDLEVAVRAAADELRQQWADAEPGLRVQLVAADADEHVYSPATQASLLALIGELPHGVLKMSEAFPGKVETSCNLAEIRHGPDSLEVNLSVRSFKPSEVERAQAEIARIAGRHGATVTLRPGYPGWEPDPQSHLLAVAKREYQRVYGREALVEVVHAGLECGVIVAKYPGMEAISFGPLIRGAHTPEEYVNVTTVAPMWELLLAILGAL